MLRKITVWAVVAVAAVLAVQVLLREGAPRSLVVPPKMGLPALDPPERGPPQPSGAASERPEEGAADGTRSPISTRNAGAAQAAEARRSGVTFRARGNEPSWLLDVSYERIGIALELGTRRIEFPYRMPTVSGARTTYRTFSGTLELNAVIDETPCNDSMSGERFASTVTVTFENRTLYGCGQPP